MKNIILTLHTLLILCLFSCRQTKVTEEEFSTKLTLLRQHATEFLPQYLETESQYENMGKKEKAEYGLFITALLAQIPAEIDFEKYSGFSIDYYKHKNQPIALASIYLYKGIIYKDKRLYTLSIQNLLYAKEIAHKHELNTILYSVYFHLSQLASFQNEKEKGIDYIKKAIQYAEMLGNKESEARAYLILRRFYTSLLKDEEALEAGRKALSLTQDSTLTGEALTDIGRSYSFLSQLDSARHYLYESLAYSHINKNEQSVRYMYLADVYDALQETDSVEKYLSKALENPIDIYFRARAYHMLVDVSTRKNDNESVRKYSELLNIVNDSLAIIENQSNINTLEQIHAIDKETTQVKVHRRYLFMTIAGLVILALFMVRKLYQREAKQKKAVDTYKTELEEKEELLDKHQEKLEKNYEMLLLDFRDEIKHIKEKYAVKRLKADFAGREEIDKKVYSEALHLENEKAFTGKMNHLLNNLPDKLKEAYPGINHKEILGCCLFMLQISTNDMCLILDYKQTSLYKFKQRLIKKLGFSSSVEFENKLYEMMNQ